ncbi:alpha/beta hydrolase [Paenibacillus sp. FSL H7-0357]|uniref:alpha/beta fold hydrolase n=1 Tax=unclassified Paenibacillus TaxID=185978 RepID=UPI0009DDCC77|nr:alpha/beta hydrolase [Paenibacillus sp. FSL H7-0357]
MEEKKKKKFKFWRIVRSIVLLLLVVLILGVVANMLVTKYEQKRYPAWGQLVEVSGKKMHVYTKGETGNTIVLLSGLGTAAPVLDFEPLMNELAQNNRVVVVEPFGSGWSERTSKQRTVENIVEEWRTALQKANVKGPYILMPHSISGIYSMYYANKYPSEVKAVIGIDPTLPQAVEYFKESAPAMPKYLSMAAPTGLVRLATYVSPKNVLPISADGTYSDENLKLTKILTAWNAYNKNVVNEASEINNNIKKTKNLSFPSNIPVMIFTTKPDKVNEEGKSNITFYETQLKNVASNKLVVLEGHHYLHWTHSKKISEEVNEFLAAYAGNK